MDDDEASGPGVVRWAFAVGGATADVEEDDEASDCALWRLKDILDQVTVER